MGIIGMGRIGQALAKRALGFSMKVLYTTKSGRDVGMGEDVIASDIDTILKESDYVVLLCYLDDSTHHLISERELKMMKPSAFIVNAARGAVIDESVLVTALQVI